MGNGGRHSELCLEHLQGNSWDTDLQSSNSICMVTEPRQGHPGLTVSMTIQYHIVAFNSISAEIMPCFYANSTDRCYSFKELFIGLGQSGKTHHELKYK